MDAPASAKKKEAVGHRDGREDEHQFREFQRLGKEEGKKGRRGGKKRERGKVWREGREEGGYKGRRERGR
jgi:hypothetical protein